MIVRIKRNGDMSEISQSKPKSNFNNMHPTYTTNLQSEAKKVSTLFRQKIAADLARSLNKGATQS